MFSFGSGLFLGTGPKHRLARRGCNSSAAFPRRVVQMAPDGPREVVHHPVPYQTHFPLQRAVIVEGRGLFTGRFPTTSRKFLGPSSGPGTPQVLPGSFCCACWWYFQPWSSILDPFRNTFSCHDCCGVRNPDAGPCPTKRALPNTLITNEPQRFHKDRAPRETQLPEPEF
jgi:hypothetical protein